MNVRRSLAVAAATAALVGGGVAVSPTASAAASCQKTTIGWYCGHYYQSPGSSPLLSQGSRGAAVREVQHLIDSTTAYYAYHNQQLSIDGDFGPRTRAAVRWFQKEYMGAGEADGIVGPKTWKELRRVP